MRLAIAKFILTFFTIASTAFAQDAHLSGSLAITHASNLVSSEKVVLATAPKDLPPTPENVTATTSGNSVTLTWTAVKGMKYSVFRAAGSEPGRVKLTENLEVGTYTDKAVKPGAYTYVVTALANGYSSEVSLPAYAAVNAAPIPAVASAPVATAAPAPAAPVAAPAPAAAVAVAAPAAANPIITPVPAEGDTKITITTAPAKQGDAIAIYSITIPASGVAPTCDASATAVPLAPNSSNLVFTGAQTTVLLKDPLYQGEVVCAVLTVGGTPTSSPTVQVTAPASPPGFDWGLVRAYFTLGALTSQERDQFSHEDLFLAFHLDKAYIRLHKISDPDNYGHRMGINTSFDTRLTSLPVAVQSCTPSQAGVTPVVTCSNASTGAATTPATASPTAQAFLNSQKSARLEFGFYTPLILHEWHVTSRSGSQTSSVPYALFAAPLMKTGFETTLNGLNQTQQSSSTPTTVQPIGTSSEFYKFYDYGFRLGHYQLAADPDVAPSMLSYVDVTFGRFANLASLICDTSKYTFSPGTNTCTNPASTPITGVLPWHREMRLNVEGLLQVPATHGFSIGFSTNVVFDPLGHSGNGVLKYVRPADDLRFLFAYKFDISKIAAKLAPQFSN